ncbi:MAG: DUF5067 domain-containing protein [Oscillibacter sp.]|nr:DUF5067 domain-containing protein [Oscillibacter sp.]
MNKWRRYLTAAAAALMVCMAAGSASGSVGKVTQELEYRNIKVTLNGEALDLRNAVGDPVEPFMFGGTNYLPVRALAEALGLEVSWDGASATVVLKEPGEEVHWVKDKGTLGDSAVEIVDAALAWDEDGSPAIVITYDWTNRTDRRTYAMSEVSEAAYQDGVELDYAGIEDDTIYDVGTSFKEVRPGTTVRVQAAYILEDTTTPVEFELTERSYLDPDTYVYHDFSLDSMELPPEPAPKPGPQENV